MIYRTNRGPAPTQVTEDELLEARGERSWKQTLSFNQPNGKNLQSGEKDEYAA